MDIIYTDIDAERLVVAYLIKSISHFEDDRSLVKPSMLEDGRLQIVLSECFRYYVQYGGLPDEKGFEQLISDNKNIPSDKQQSYILLFSQLRSLADTTNRPQFLSCVDSLIKLEKRRQLFSITQEIRDGLQGGLKEEEIFNRIISKAYDSDQVVGNVIFEGSIKDGFDQRLDLYTKRKTDPQSFKGIPYGIKVLDHLTSGFFPGELNIVFARSGAGKSRFLNSVAYNVFSRGYNIMYVTVEMPKDQVFRMFDSRHFKISNTGLRHGSLTSEEERKYFNGKNLLERHPGDFYLVDVPENCSVTTLLPIIRKYKLRKPLHAIFVDYINIMAPSKYVKGNQSDVLGEVARELKVLGRKEQLGVFSAVQANRDAVKVKNIEEVGTENVFNSDQVAYHSDLLLYLKQNGAEGEIQKELDGYIVKYRDGKHKSLKLGVSWDYSFIGDFDDLLNDDSKYTIPFTVK